MKPSDFNRHLSFIVLLLLPATGTESFARMGRNFEESLESGVLGSRAETPYWEFILREFLFKTISPPPPANYDLYKRLLEAPFYRGPFPASIANDDELAAARSLLSRGYVYHLADGGWIICQEGCTDCDVCKDHETATTPTVKWTLRRIKRPVPFARPRYDLQLTVSPQADGTFHTRNLYPVSYVYVTSNTGVLKSFADTLINREKKQYPLPTRVSVPEISENIFTTSRTEATTEGETKLKVGNDGSTDRSNLTTSTSVPTTRATNETKQVFSSRKRGRDVNQKGEENHQDRIDRDGHVKRVVEPSKPTEKSIPLILFYPSTAPAAATTDAGCRMPKNPRLILGTDQFGEKQLVHVVPAGDLDADITTPSVDAVVRPISRKLGRPQVSDVVREYEDRPLYRKIFNRVVESLNDHKSAIEKFLLSPSLRSGRPSVAPTTFVNEASAGLTTLNYPARTSSTDIDLQDAKVNAVAPSRVGVAAQPRDTPSSNYSAPQVHQSSKVESQRSEPSPTTARKLQLLDPSAADRFKNKTKVREASVGVPDDQRSTVRSNTDISSANATRTSVVPSGIPNERLDSRRFQEQLVNPGELDLDENRTTRSEDLRNISDTLILKEVARSVVDHADTLRDLVVASNSYRASEEQADAVGKDLRTAGHTRTEEKLVGN